MGQVYPRVYGESGHMRLITEDLQGLSPRVRGIHHCDRYFEFIVRSIPACTGNPKKNVKNAGPPAVYPRVYGESLNICT